MEWNKFVSGCVFEQGTAKVAQLSCIPALFQVVVEALLSFSGLVAIFIIIYAGIKFITARGDKKQIEQTQSMLTYAILGLVIVLLAFFFINVISTVVHVPCIKSFGFDNCQ